MNTDMLRQLFEGVLWIGSLDGLKGIIMIVVGCVLLWLAIVKDFEPLLLLPIGSGCIWANLPFSSFLGEYVKCTQPIADQAAKYTELMKGASAPSQSVLDAFWQKAAEATGNPYPLVDTLHNMIASGKCFGTVDSAGNVTGTINQMLLIDANRGGMLATLYNVGVANELFPLLIFVGIGAMTDFGPLLENPKMIFLGGAGQFGIFLTLLLALAIGFSKDQAASIGIIGAIDGPTSIYVSSRLAPDMLGPITVAAYSYMSLVPVIMPPVMRLFTSPKQRAIKMPYSSREITRTTRIVFPIAVTIIVGILVPFALPLVGSLMIGNIMRESGAVERLSGAAQNELNNIVTLFLGLAIGSTMVGANFINIKTLAILLLGLFAFAADTAVGVCGGHIYRIVTGGHFNPLIGAAGISAFPMASRVVQKEASKADYSNFILMHAMGANAAGQIASAMAGGVLLALVPPGLT